MRLEKCYFCSSTIYPGHGTIFVRNDCRIFRFCRSKCNKLFKKKRNPRKTKWTKASRSARGKELTGDTAQTFELRREEPVKYTRQLWKNTVDAVKQVSEVKGKRQDQHIKNSLKKGKTVKRLQEVKRTTKHIHLIRSPAANLSKSKTKKAADLIPQEEDMLMEEN